VSPPRSERPQFGGEGIEVGVSLATQRLAQDIPHFSFRRTSVPCSTALEPGEQIVVEIPHAQTSHCTIACG
jgi:hypothetical protein